MESPLVGVVLVNYNGLGDTLDCLDSLRNQLYTNIKVLVIDNRSDSDELTVIESHPIGPICLQNATNLGFAEASNIGMKTALDGGADYVLLLNNDSIVKPDFLVRLLEAMEKYSSVGIAGPKITCYPNINQINSGGGRIYWRIGYIRDLGFNKKDNQTLNTMDARDWISGCAMLIRRKVIETISFLDSRNFPQGGEDYDYCVRASIAGYKILYCPRSVVLHKGSKTRRKMGAVTITLVEANRRDPKVALLEKYKKRKRIGKMARICYVAFLRPFEALTYLVFTKDPQLRLFYHQRFLQRIRIELLPRIRRQHAS
jgi:GT2 family glycosyltransferase